MQFAVFSSQIVKKGVYLITQLVRVNVILPNTKDQFVLMTLMNAILVTVVKMQALVSILMAVIYAIVQLATQEITVLLT